MGAVTVIRYAATDPRISCILCDSPFSDLRKLALDFAKEHSKVPSFLVKGALSFVKRSIKKRAKFNIKDLDQTKEVKKCWIPAIFVTSKEDLFVKAWHIEQLFELYAGGEKRLVYVRGDHNAPRPKSFFIDSMTFLKEHLIKNHINVHLSNPKIQGFSPEETKKDKGIFKAVGVFKGPEKNEKLRHGSIERKHPIFDRKLRKNSDNSDEEDSDSEEKRGKSADRGKISGSKSSIFHVFFGCDYLP